MANIKNLSNIKQVFYHYEKWEDYLSGMYNPPSVSSIETGISTEERIKKAIECLSNEDICRKYMEKVVSEWKISTEEVLTNPESNGRAWLGQCACFMYGGCHDEETRKAWVLLPPETQKKANAIADNVIREWLTEYAKTLPNYQLTFDDLLGENND
ncbi:MAG: hypothetical protein ACI4MS_08165 [Candidatus Coproplasma sp.]